MKSKQTTSIMIALAAIIAVAISPMALAVEEVSVDAIQEIPARDTSDRAQVQFRGGTDGWAIIGGQAHTAEIGISGNAVRADNGVWKIKSEAEITVPDRHATLELKGKAVHGKIKLYGTGTLDSGRQASRGRVRSPSHSRRGAEQQLSNRPRPHLRADRPSVHAPQRQIPGHLGHPSGQAGGQADDDRFQRPRQHPRPQPPDLATGGPDERKRDRPRVGRGPATTQQPPATRR